MVPDAQRALTRKKNAPGKGALQFHQQIAACKPLTQHTVPRQLYMNKILSSSEIVDHISVSIEPSLQAIREAALSYAERHRLALFAIDPATRTGSLYAARCDRQIWETDFARGMQLGLSACMSGCLLFDVDVHGPEDREEAWKHYEALCAEMRLTDAQGSLPMPYGHSKSGGWHFAFRVPPGFADTLRKGHHKFKISHFRELKPGEEDRERISVRWRALNVFPGSVGNGGGVYQLAENAPPPHPYGPNTAGLFEWYAGLKVGQKAVTSAPPTDECTQSEAECAKLDRFVRELMLKDPHWFEDRDNRRETVWGIKRAGFGHRGYEIGEIICDVTEDGKGNRLNRYWNDAGANTGTKTLASFWKHCASQGIQQTPAEIAGWRGDEAIKSFEGIAAPIPTVESGEATTAPGQAPPLRSLRTISAASFAGKPAPEREELVSDLIPAKIIGGLYGDGAVGKSLLAMMLGVAVATGRPWLNRIVRKGPVVYVCCEDDEAEVHRRLENICREMNVDMAALGDFHIVPLVDEDSVLASSDVRSNVLTTTPLYAQLVELTGDVKPQLLIGDTLADIFAGSENDRMQAKQFVKLMRKLVIPHGGTGLILAHPSVDGMRSGKGTSGSTGWNNSFRWRGYLDKVLDEQDNEPDPTHRVLRTKKLNYGPQGGEIELRYQNGCYVLRSHGVNMSDPMWRTKRADRVFLDLLRKGIAQNNRVSLQPKGGCYAPTIFRTDASKQGVTFAEMKEAMQRLIDSNKIENAPYGAPSKQQFRLYVNS
jgi:RecA-family ATPase